MRRRTTIALVLAMLVGVFVAPSPASAAEFPGGRRIYTVSLGSMPPAGQSGGPVWVRLAMYFLSADGTIRESFWYWNRATAVGAVSSGVSSSGCDNCPVRTAGGFQNAAKELTGTWTYSGDIVTIHWSEGSTETWRHSEPSSDLSRLELTGSNYDANVGWGFGSLAPANSYVQVSQIPKVTYRGRYQSALGTGVGQGGSSVMNLQDYITCNANCMSELSPPSDACSACPNGAPNSPIRYYLAGNGRRNFYEHWCKCLTTAQCYVGGSHRKPYLQVIGDTGVFHGWVGVEASNFDANTGYFAVNYHVDV